MENVKEKTMNTNDEQRVNLTLTRAQVKLVLATLTAAARAHEKEAKTSLRLGRDTMASASIKHADALDDLYSDIEMMSESA